jgi:hypothetical protein
MYVSQKEWPLVTVVRPADERMALAGNENSATARGVW